MRLLFIQAVYLLALINPVSKVAILAVLPSPIGQSEYGRLLVRSSMVAASIILGAMIAGDWLLRSVFHVEMHSLRVAGGVVLFWFGFSAMRSGVFYEQEAKTRYADLAIVPLACPMIAGPATIVAAITLRAQHGVLVPTAAMLLAVVLNHVIMLLAKPIAATLKRFNVLGALIRLTGLIVMAIGTQMVFDGIREWDVVLRQASGN